MSGDGKEMTFFEHLTDLRKCLIRACYGIIACSVLTLCFATDIFNVLKMPIVNYFPGVQLIGTGPTEAFIVKLKMGLAAGFILALPYTFLEVWRFISPGLHEHEKRMATPFVCFSTLFFLIGLSFCYFVVLPFAFGFFAAEFMSVGLSPQIRISEYLSFAVGLSLIFGIMFEMPLFAYILARLGLLTPEWLKKQFRFAVVVIFIVAAILTPPDVVTQTLLAVPLVLLYLLCIFVTKVAIQQKAERSAGAGVPTVASKRTD